MLHPSLSYFPYFGSTKQRSPKAQRTDGQIDGRTGGWMDRRQTDGRTDGQTHKWTDPN